jgi:hypothetical protein
MDIKELRELWESFGKEWRIALDTTLEELEDASLRSFYEACADDDYVDHMWHVDGDEVEEVMIDAKQKIFEFHDSFLKVGAKIVYTYSHDCADANPDCDSGFYIYCLTIKKEIR